MRKAFEDKVEETATKNATIKSDPKANLRAYRSYINGEDLAKERKEQRIDESIESLYERAPLRNPYESELIARVRDGGFLLLQKLIFFRSSAQSVSIIVRTLIEKIECCACNSDPQTANIAAMTEAFGDILINSSLKSFKGANDVALAFLRAKWKDKNQISIQ